MQVTTADLTASAATALSVASRNRTFLRAGLLAGGLTLAALLLTPQLRELPAVRDAFVAADPAWMAMAAVCAISAYGAGALALQASTDSRLPLRRNLQVQLASVAVGALTPAGAGGLALHCTFSRATASPAHKPSPR